MTKNLFIVPYNTRSRGCRFLKKQLGAAFTAWGSGTASRILIGSPGVIINWGVGSKGRIPRTAAVYNHPSWTRLASNKTLFFELMSKSKDPPRIPLWTKDVNIATEWIQKGKQVLARHLQSGKGGKGIQFHDEGSFENFLTSALFTVYMKKKDEYRVHCFKDEIFDIQKKVLPADRDQNVDFRIRTHDRGFIFARHDLNVPEDVLLQAQKAFKASKLDFGAVDVVYNEHYNQACVLEINTAPGIEGTTAENYVHMFKTDLFKKFQMKIIRKPGGGR